MMTRLRALVAAIAATVLMLWGGAAPAHAADAKSVQIVSQDGRTVEFLVYLDPAVATSTDAELRYLAVSTTRSPDMFHYPDSGKTGASHYAGDGDVIRLRNRIDHNLDYWDGE